MKRVLAIILGGGAGTRLYPLTKLRAKPAVPLGAKYGLIDIPISNCINSEIHRIYVLTQFNSASLNRHLWRTYALASTGFSPGFVEVLAAQQTLDSPSWFEGTADAVRKYLRLFAEWDVDEYLILADEGPLVPHELRRFCAAPSRDESRHHPRGRARDRTAGIGLRPAPARSRGRVRGFSEKPTGAALHAMQVDTTLFGLSAARARRRPISRRWGYYVFAKQVLHELLTPEPTHTDFGKDVLPLATSASNVQAYLLPGLLGRYRDD